jgi:hypothetical protein
LIVLVASAEKYIYSFSNKGSCRISIDDVDKGDVELQKKNPTGRLPGFKPANR